jgi:hypothetical protein
LIPGGPPAVAAPNGSAAKLPARTSSPQPVDAHDLTVHG